MADQVLTPDELLAGSGITAEPLADAMRGVPLPVPGGAAPAPAATTSTAPAKLSGRTVRVVNPRGEVGDIPEENLEAAQRAGYQLETPEHAAVREYVAENKGLGGAAKVALGQFANQALLGLPETIYDHTADPLEVAKKEALKKEHEFANAAGGVAGFGASLAVGGPLFKGAQAAGQVAERAVLGATERIVAERLAAAGVEQGAKSIARGLVQKTLASAAKMGVEGGVIAAPQAITEAALGDPDAAAETLLWNVGAGAALGVISPVAKSLVRGALDGVKGIRVTRAAEGAESLGARATSSTTDTITAELSDAAGPVSGAVDAASEAWLKRQKVGDDAKAALRRVLKDDAAMVGKQEELLDEAARAWKKVGDVAMHVDDVVLPKIAFGEGKAEQMAKLVDPDKWETASSVLNNARKLVDEKVAELESFVDKGGSDAVVKRLRKALESFEQKTMFSTENQYSYEAVRDGYMYLDKLKRDVGKQAGMGLKPYQRNVAQSEAYTLYHELLPALENEDAWGKAAIAQREVNAATAKKLGTSEAFKSAFITDFEKKAGNSVSEFDPGDIKSYLRNVLGAENDLKERALTEWIGGLDAQMSAVERNYTLSAAEQAEFAKARDALAKFQAGIGEAKENAKAIALIKRMQEDERGKAIGGLAGVAVDFFTRPVTVAERLAAARKLVLKIEKSGVLTAEQSMKRAAEQLDRVPEVIRSLARKTASSAEALPSRTALALFGSPDGSREERYLHAAERLSQARANLEQTADRIAQISGGLADGGAPNIAAAYTAAQQRALEYLYATMPKSRGAPELFGPRKPFVPSEREMLAWERRADVVENPFSVLAHVEQGTLTAEHVDALRNVYPRLYAEIAKRIAQHAADPNAPVLAAPERARIATLLGLDTPANDPASIRRLQQGMTAKDPNKLPAPAPSTQKLPSLETPAQRIMNR